MSMRYIIRRPHAEDLKEVESHIRDLPEKLGKPDANLRRFLKIDFSPLRYAQYQFFTRKEGAAYQWVCPSIELVAEDESGLFALTEMFHIPKPDHLKHLPA